MLKFSVAITNNYNIFMKGCIFSGKSALLNFSYLKSRNLVMTYGHSWLQHVYFIHTYYSLYMWLIL